MERPAHRPGTDDGAFGKSNLDVALDRTRHAQSDSPQRTAIVLRLHGAEPAHDVGRRLAIMYVDSLVAEPRADHVDLVHDRRVYAGPREIEW